jgi:hypothetical protein
MNTQFNKTVNVIKYFFSPEDSATPIQNGLIYFEIEPNRIGIGSAKALFWVMNCMIFMYLLSLL